MRLLCVGGPRAGDYIKVQEGMEYVQVLERPKPPDGTPVPFGPVDFMATETRHTYKVEYLIGGANGAACRQEYTVLAMPGTDVIRELLLGYRRSK